MQGDLFAPFVKLAATASPEEFFSSDNLTELFLSKISKSQATGKDGVRVGRFTDQLEAEVKLIEKKVLNGTYSFTAYKERLLLRGADREPRQISIPTVRDRLALRALCQILHKFVPGSVGSSPHALVRQVVASIKAESKGLSFVRIDVRNFFPSVKHAQLSKEISYHGIDGRILELCMKAVATPTGTSNEPNVRGIPQGLSVSGALAAIFMLNFDVLQRKRNSRYFRYVDDILLICPTEQATQELKFIRNALARRGLIAHDLRTKGKTDITPVAEGVDFLGYRISLQGVSIRDTSYRRMFRNILKVITDFRYRKDVNRTLFRINLKITGCIVDLKRRGWMMFFSQTENKFQLAFLDKFVNSQLRRVEFPENRINEVKTFVKSYHEIKFRLDKTNYIPNFDTYDNEQKIWTIASLLGRREEEIMAWDIELIEREFSRLVSKEIHDLEEDVGNPS